MGGGAVAYIKMLTSDEASRMFPAVEGLPQGINLFSLHAADGTPLALTDTKQAAIGHAIDDDLEIASVHGALCFWAASPTWLKCHRGRTGRAGEIARGTSARWPRRHGAR